MIADDISVAANGDIRLTGGSDNYTVLELHRFLNDLADDAVASGDDLLDINSPDPSSRSTDQIIELINGYNIDDALAERLYDGSIIQANGDTIYDGILIFAPQGTYVDVIQNGALVSNFWTTGINPDAGLGVSHRFLVKVRDAGADIDGRRLLGQTRELGSTFAEFPVNGTARGNNVIALAPAPDLNNQTAEATIATWSNITSVEGYQLFDVDVDSVNEPYYVQFDRDTQSINDLFERVKWQQRRGTSETIFGLSGDLFRGVTHEIDVDTPTGTFNAFEPVSWTGGTGQMLAIDSPTAGTKMWLQLLTGVAPTDGQTITGGTSSATVDVNVTVTTRSVSLPYIGASTGSAIIGGFGVGVEPADLTNADQLTDLGNTQRVPPNNVTYSVQGVVAGEDYILTGIANGGNTDIDYTQFTANGAQSSGAGTFVVNEAIPSDTPPSGTIRVFNGTVYEVVPYASFSGSTFTLTGTLPSNVADTDPAYVSYIDTLAGASTEQVTFVFNGSLSLFTKVRDGGGTPIVPFSTPATVGAGGGSSTVIRTSDE